MNEELKIIISAQVDKLKTGCKQATEAIDGIDKEAKETSNNSEKHFSKMGDAAAKAGKAIAKGLAVGFAAAAAGVVAITKQAIEGYAEYEQLIGGVDTLFKDSSQKVQTYASNAYKTVGMSANDYMSMATNLSASMIASLGGDVDKAADMIDMAMTDIADNANKMGTPIENIQNAYQGFAKQNYTMLDNLKLGYGGTKEEMERLLADAEKLSGVKYDISNLSDISEAIHVIQTDIGITGTTAKEAASTISGSVAMTKAAWSNLVVGIANDNADFDTLISNFVDSASAALGNIIPRLEIALNGIASLIQKMVPVLMDLIPPLITDVLPKILEAAVSIVEGLIQGIVQAFPALIQTLSTLLPQVVTMLAELIPQITGALLESLPLIIETILQLAAQIVTAIGEILPQIHEQIASIIPQIVTTLAENIPVLLEAAVNALMAIVEAIPVVIPMLIEALPQIIESILNTVVTAIPLLLNGAIQLFTAIIDAIPKIIISLGKALPDIITTIIKAVVEAIPLLLDGAINLLTAIIDAIPVILPVLIETLPDIIEAILSAIMDALPLVIDAAIQLLLGIVTAVPQILPALIGALPKILNTIINALIDYTPRLLRQGVDMFMGIVNSITQIIPSLISGISKIITTIKDKLVNAAKKVLDFKWQLPKLKMPHLKITGEFSLSPPKVPSFKIDWYAQGGVFDKPTLFPYGDGAIGGLGEAGAEAVVPLEKNTQWLDRIAERLGANTSNRPIYLMVDKRVLAQTSVEGINDLTRATGSIPLVLA